MIAPHGFAAVSTKQFERSRRAEQIKTPYITGLIKRSLSQIVIRTILIYALARAIYHQPVRHNEWKILKVAQ
jgi:hypothetical protein